MSAGTKQLALVALGSNLGQSRQIISGAMASLQQLSAEPLLKSSIWRSAPVDCPPGSPDFLNAAVAFVPRAAETPESLLVKLQDLEREFGRQPKRLLNEPRPLDLDLIAFGNETRSKPELTLPHPRAHLRRFVLEPLNEIAPEFVFPGQTRSVRDLLSLLNGKEQVECLAFGDVRRREGP
ncbi:MAG: 2-amino-4-hydroxy-6-hydroxymethyldihydropteridine diphosphokinase [Verrucomicrobia bacterium]|nr:2-amino-4-hydroxy-6-hydroxymethyldihydropteridine diphosphokinase [Verrucomicrobiota bacterium]